MLTSIWDTTRHSLEIADYFDCNSVVFPLLGCGSGGVHTHEGAQLICEEIWDYESTNLTDVRVIGYSDREVGILEDIVSNE